MALLLALLVGALLLAFGGGLTIVASTELQIAAHHRDGVAAFYVADGVLQRLVAELGAASGVDRLLAGPDTAWLAEGPPSGTRVLGPSTIDLEAATHMERCGRAVCTDAQLTARTLERPWGPDNPRWRLYAWGTVPQAGVSPVYVLAWIGDDPDEIDGNPLADGAPGRPGHGRVLLRVHAYGGHGARRALDALVVDVPGSPRIERWLERR